MLVQLWFCKIGIAGQNHLHSVPEKNESYTDGTCSFSVDTRHLYNWRSSPSKTMLTCFKFPSPKSFQSCYTIRYVFVPCIMYNETWWWNYLLSHLRIGHADSDKVSYLCSYSYFTVMTVPKTKKLLITPFPGNKLS